MASLEEENRHLEKTPPTRQRLRRSKEGVNEDCSYCHDVNLSHSGRENSEREQGGTPLEKDLRDKSFRSALLSGRRIQFS